MLPSRYRRLLNEMEQLKWEIDNKKLDSVEILQMEEFKHTIILLSGGLDSPYEGYWFRIKLQWPEDYPFRPPKCTFLDKIWNPYVDFEKGQICMDILSDQFSPALTSIQIILSIISLLSEDEISQDNNGFINPEAAIQMLKNCPHFKQHARELCQKHSFKKKQIYSDNMRGIQQERAVEVQSHLLPQVISQNLASERFNKKPAMARQRLQQELQEEQFEDYAFDLSSQNQSSESSSCSQLYQQSQVSNPFSEGNINRSHVIGWLDKNEKLSDEQLKELIEKRRKQIRENLQKYGQTSPPRSDHAI